MRIAVCIKQVPAASLGTTDPDTGIMVRTGSARLNPCDGAALEAAISLNRPVDAFTMGPQRAEQVLREALAMGVEAGWLLSDPAFAGADSLITAYTLMQGLRRAGGFDLIICGARTTDGDTGQVGPALAELLQVPFFGRVCQMSVAFPRLHLEHRVGSTVQEVRAAFPSVVSVERECFPPRIPSLRMKMAAGKKTVHVLSRCDLEDQGREHYGLAASPTRIRRVYTPSPVPVGNVQHVSGAEAAHIVLQYHQEEIRHEE